MVWIYGASGHGKVIMEILEMNQIPLGGFIDDNETINEFMGYKVLRRTSFLNTSLDVIIGVGSNLVRKKITKANTFCYSNAIHPSAVFSKHSNIDNGSVVMAYAVVQPGCQIGKHVIINTGATIDHDCILDDFVHISPGATLCGNVVVGEGSWIGAGTIIIQGVCIGKNVIVGAGSVIRKNVPDNVTIVGNPQKIIKVLK